VPLVTIFLCPGTPQSHPTITLTGTPRRMRAATASTSSRRISPSASKKRRSVTARNAAASASASRNRRRPRSLTSRRGRRRGRRQPSEASPSPSSTAYVHPCRWRAEPNTPSSVSSQWASMRSRYCSGLSWPTALRRSSQTQWSSVSGCVGVGLASRMSTRAPSANGPPFSFNRPRVSGSCLRVIGRTCRSPPASIPATQIRSPAMRVRWLTQIRTRSEVHGS